MSDRTCSVDGCERVHEARGFCNRHYTRFKRGQPVEEPRPHELTVEQRFWAKVSRAPGGCWLWTGGLNTGGYPRFALTHTVTVMAHRFAYELLVGPISDGLQLDHVAARGCTHRHCVNPAHLEPVTPAENLRRSTGPSAVNGSKTACVAGHPLSGENLYVRPNGKRECVTCRTQRKRRERSHRGR